MTRKTQPLLRSSLLLLTLAFGACDPEEEPSDDRDDHDEEDADASPEDDGGGSERDGGADESCHAQDVDLLFVIDNSGSMGQEQAKLARTVPQLLSILATGNRSGKRSVDGEPTDFAAARTIHVGVVSTDLAINKASNVNSCGERSFEPADRDPLTSNIRVSKPFGDDGRLLTSTAVATSGIHVRLEPGSQTLTQVVQPDPSCMALNLDAPYLSYNPGDRFEDTGHSFSCISKLGRNGCGIEQQLEAMLKAVTPASSSIEFSRGSRGHGSSEHAGFLREEAVLAVIVISDEEDCSIPDASSVLFDVTSTAVPGGLNVRCGLRENQSLLHPVARYVDGLRALKTARYQDRILFAGITGVPLAKDSGAPVHKGTQALTALLSRPDMQFTTRRNIAGTDDEPAPTCTSPAGDGVAAPGRRFVEVAQGFGDNGLVTSICDDSYMPLIEQMSERIAGQLGSSCKSR